MQKVLEDRQVESIVDSAILPRQSSVQPTSSTVNEIEEVPALSEVTPTTETVMEANDEVHTVSTGNNQLQKLALTGNRRNVPLSYRAKYVALLKKLIESRGFYTDPSNQIVLPDNRVLRNSNFHKVFAALFTNTSKSKNSTSLPTGFNSFVTALREVGVKPNEVISPVAKQALVANTKSKQGGSGIQTRGLSFPPGKRVRLLKVY